LPVFGVHSSLGQLSNTYLKTVKDVTERKFFVPVTPWPSDPKFRQIGQWQLQNMMDAARSGGWLLLRATGMAPEEVEQLIVEVKEELFDSRSHPYAYWYV
jgi:hypothetical protein